MQQVKYLYQQNGQRCFILAFIFCVGIKDNSTKLFKYSNFYYWSCSGEQGSPEGPGVCWHQPEALCQSHADADGPDTDAEASLCQSGGSHAQAVAVLCLCSWGKGHVSCLIWFLLYEQMLPTGLSLSDDAVINGCHRPAVMKTCRVLPAWWASSPQISVTWMTLMRAMKKRTRSPWLPQVDWLTHALSSLIFPVICFLLSQPWHFLLPLLSHVSRLPWCTPFSFSGRCSRSTHANSSEPPRSPSPRQAKLHWRQFFSLRYLYLTFPFTPFSLSRADSVWTKRPSAQFLLQYFTHFCHLLWCPSRVILWIPHTSHLDTKRKWESREYKSCHWCTEVLLWAWKVPAATWSIRGLFVWREITVTTTKRKEMKCGDIICDHNADNRLLVSMKGLPSHT